MFWSDLTFYFRQNLRRDEVRTRIQMPDSRIRQRIWICMIHPVLEDHTNFLERLSQLIIIIIIN